MASTIGVKIELEGAPQYKENMQNLTAQTKLYDAQLKRLQTELSSSASAFTKSMTESKALKQQLEAQTNQAKLLSDQIAKTTEKYGEDSTQVIRLKTQYEKLQTEIAKTTQALEENGGVWGAVAAEFEEVGNKMQDLGGKISSVGDALTKGITAPITAIGAASTAAWKEVDEGMDTIIKKTGATGEALEGLQTVAENIATSMPASFAEVGDAVGEVNTRFGLTGQELEDLSTKFIEFSQLNDTSVSTSIDNVQAAMAAFGIDASKAGDVLDILNKAGQDTGIGMDSLSNALLSNAASLTEMGYGIESAAGLIANLEKNGVDSSAAMAGLKKAFQNASKEGITMDEALKNLEIAMSSAETNTESYQAAMELFGNKAGPALAKAIQEGRLSFDEAANAVKEYGDSVSSTFDATLDPLDQMQQNMNQLKLVGADLVTTSAPMITKALEEMAGLIQKLSDAWSGLSEDEQETIIKVTGLVAVIGPALSIVGRIITSIGTIATGISSLMGVIAPVGAFLTGTIIPAMGALVTAIAPFLPIIAAVGAAIAALVIVIKNWGAITDWMSEKVQMLQTYVTEHFGLIGEIISTKIEIIKTVVTAAVDVIKTVVKAGMDIIKAVMEGDWSKVGEIIKRAWMKIQVTIDSAKEKVKESISNLLNSIKDKFSDIKDAALNWGKDMIQNFIDGITAKWQALKDKVAGVAETISSYLHFSVPEKGPLHTADTWMPDFMKLLADGISKNQSMLQNAMTTAIEGAIVGPVEMAAQPMTIGKAIEYPSNNRDILASLGEIVELLPALANSQIVLDTGALVGQTAPAMNDALGQIYVNEQRSI